MCAGPAVHVVSLLGWLLPGGAITRVPCLRRSDSQRHQQSLSGGAFGESAPTPSDTILAGPSKARVQRGKHDGCSNSLANKTTLQTGVRRQSQMTHVK